ncbi:VOC family protein [Glycomyces sp. TRM65418]|uniref:VOC family protein n=1 Tax=Glycomyces sp. TRM65418 TaxID=2867006 RepID=UPI001CE60929|nr:VOC family protein [Glycomyces sp. TRM65418]MCC3761637.1 VOC family protein [Glycomyces sp. TRM65418]QZD55731.1 VOC family protein [Glycomyces sp. TRM65418]
MSSLDHIVLATPDLAATVGEIARLTGTRPVPGGAHPGLGTGNYLLGLGEGAYLEIVGPDPDQDAPQAPRPFGIDGLAEARVMAWAVRVDGIDAAVAAARETGYDPGEPREMARQIPNGERLTWRLTLDVERGHAGLVPFLIDWGRSPHPSANLPTVPLVALEGVHPHPERIEPSIASLGAKLPVKAGNRPSLAATVFGETGLVVLH